MVFMPDAINWNTPAGKLLILLAKKLPPHPPQRIVVFGSAPLQMLLDAEFTSADVDILGEESLARFVTQQNLARRQEEFGFQVCALFAFSTALCWESRVQEAKKHGHTFVFPHPWDILVSKLQRLDEKDLEAFRLVIRKTGHPTAEEFKRHLQLAVDLYRPRFDEEKGGDMFAQTNCFGATFSTLRLTCAAKSSSPRWNDEGKISTQAIQNSKNGYAI